MSDVPEQSADEQVEDLARLAQVACAAWQLADEPEVTLLKFRENAVFRIDAGEARYVMRVHRRGYHTAEALRSELQWMTALRDSGVSTPEVLPSRSGALFETVSCPGVAGPRLVDLLSWVEGSPLGSLEDSLAGGEATTAAFRETGRLMARLHNHAQRWQRPPGFTRHAWDADGLLGPEPLWGRFWELEALDPDGREVVLAARTRLRDDLAAFGAGPDRYGLIHADFLPENLLVDQGTVQLIDFDDAGFGWHLFDIATSLFVVADNPAIEDLLAAFTAGYRAARDLPDEDLAELPMFLLLRGLTYLGWLHTRQETTTAREMTPQVVPAIVAMASDYLAAVPAR
ncbi:phosphotransferase [Streptomyces sp. 372A]